MPRSRNIKPALFVNELLGSADPMLSLLFIGLWCLADRDGRLEDRPARIKAELFPYRDLPIVNGDCPFINGELTVLARMGFIVRYEVGGKHYIEILNFSKHQTPHHTEKKSAIPPPPEPSTTQALTPITVNSPLHNGEAPVNIPLIPDSLIPDSRTPISPSGTFASCFEIFWKHYPKAHRTGKQAAYRAYQKAGKRIVAQKSITRDAAVEFLRIRVIEFASSPKGKSEFVKAPAAWLNAGSYDDEPEAWQRIDRQGDKPVYKDQQEVLPIITTANARVFK